MGSKRVNRSRGAAGRFGALSLALAALVGCTSDDAPQRATVTPEFAYTAIVRWEIERSEPVLDDDGNPEPPVIYLAAGSGGTVDVAVQASVVAAIEDDAVIRFADNARDARDEDLEGEPVKDEGVMILVDEIPTDQATVDARISTYRSIDDEATWILEIRATSDGAEVTAAIPADPVG